LKEELQKKYDDILNGLDVKTARLLHLNSVGNFILYFDKLEGKYQTEVGELLLDYFDAIKNDNNILSGGSIDSYFYDREYISKIGIVYVSQLDFSFETTIRANIVIAAMVLIICFFVDSLILNVVVGLYMLWEVISHFKNIKQRKYYKVGW